jgi:hypothetical protein
LEPCFIFAVQGINDPSAKGLLMASIWIRTLGFVALCVAGGCASGPAKSTDRDALREYWARYLADDPVWPDLREEWIRRGPEDRRILLDNLFQELLLGYGQVLGSGSPSGVSLETSERWRRARREIVYLRSDAVDYGLEFLDMLTEKPKVDWMMVDLIGQLLADLHAAGEVGEAMVEGSRSTASRAALIQALSFMAADDASIEPLARACEGDPHWRNRALAAEALEPLAKRDARAQQALIQALRDADPYVTKQAAHSLRNVREKSVQKSLIDCYVEVYAEANLAMAQVLYNVLKTNTQQLLLSTNPEEWQEWYGRQYPEG